MRVRQTRRMRDRQTRRMRDRQTRRMRDKRTDIKIDNVDRGERVIDKQ